MNEAHNRQPTLTRKKVAAYLEVSVPTLARWASNKEGPPYYNIGGKTRYRVAELDAWVETRRRNGGSSGGSAAPVG